MVARRNRINASASRLACGARRRTNERTQGRNTADRGGSTHAGRPRRVGTIVT